MLEARLVESLRGHVKVLHLKLLDAVAQRPVHLAHVNELVVDLVDFPLVVTVRSVGKELLGTAVLVAAVEAAELAVLRVTHCDL